LALLTLNVSAITPEGTVQESPSDEAEDAGCVASRRKLSEVFFGMRTRQTIAQGIADHSRMSEGERRKLALRCEEALAAAAALRAPSDELDQRTIDFYIDVWTTFVLKGCNDPLPAFANIGVQLARELRHALTTGELF
jgi:hypothetical protein